jgi:hypothetical protein
MSFMELFIYRKGATYSADCDKCGASIYWHEWTSDGQSDDLKEGRAPCPHCHGRSDPDTFMYCGRQYAGRYSAPGYMDCTDWSYSPNKRTLARELRDLYGDD